MSAVIQAILAVKGIIDVTIQVAALVAEWSRDRAKEKSKQSIEAAHTAIKKAGEIKDAVLRRKAKAAATCQLEKAIDPASDCVAEPSDDNL
jgi:hypothetical protein